MRSKAEQKVLLAKQSIETTTTKLHIAQSGLDKTFGLRLKLTLDRRGTIDLISTSLTICPSKALDPQEQSTYLKRSNKNEK